MLPLPPLLPPGRPPGRFLSVWGRAVHLVDEGDASDAGSRDQVVLLESGLGGSWLGWHQVVAELLPDADADAEVDAEATAEPECTPASTPEAAPTRPLRVLRADRPGLGRSQPAPGVPSLALRAAWTAALLDELGVRAPVVVCGHSLGGLYADAFARLYPQRVAGVVLVEAHAPNVTGAVLDHRDARVATARLVGHAVRCAGLSQLVAPAVRRLGMRTQSVRRGDQADVGDAYRSAYGAGHCFTEALVERVLVRDFLAELAELRRTTRFPQVPLRVLSGVGAAPEVYGAQARMSPLGRHVEVEGTLHLMPVDRPDAIAAAVREATAGPPRALPSPPLYDACP